MTRSILHLSAFCLLSIIAGACTTKPMEKPATDQNVTLLAVDLHRDHGWAAIRAERYKEAGSYFKRILRDRPDDQDAMLGLAETFLGLHQLDQAGQRFERIDDQATRAIRAKALQGQGIIRLRRGDHDEARQLLTEAIELDPRLWRSWNALGRVHDADQDFAAARYAYRQAIKLSPKVGYLHNNLGFSLLASGEPAYAESSLQKALELDPDLSIATSNLRLALALQGRYGSALSGVDAAERPTVMNNIGYAALLRGDHQKARSLFLGAMEANPAFFGEARSNLAFLDTLEADRTFTPENRR